MSVKRWRPAVLVGASRIESLEGILGEPRSFSERSCVLLLTPYVLVPWPSSVLDLTKGPFPCPHII